MANATKSKNAAKRLAKAVVDPTQLKPFTKKGAESTVKPGDDVLQVVIETPKGCRNKYSFDPEQEIFVLKAALPAGMVFPYDFGFVPRTKGEDGDPLDVLVLMDEPAFAGCAVLTRLIGVIEGEQTTPGSPPVRNDRLVAVAETTHVYRHFRKIKDVPKKTVKEIEEFFVNYHKLQGKRFKLLGVHGEKRARKLIAAAKA